MVFQHSFSSKSWVLDVGMVRLILRHDKRLSLTKIFRYLQLALRIVFAGVNPNHGCVSCPGAIHQHNVVASEGLPQQALVVELAPNRFPSRVMNGLQANLLAAALNKVTIVPRMRSYATSVQSSAKSR